MAVFGVRLVNLGCFLGFLLICVLFFMGYCLRMWAIWFRFGWFWGFGLLLSDLVWLTLWGFWVVVFWFGLIDFVGFV